MVFVNPYSYKILLLLQKVANCIDGFKAGLKNAKKEEESVIKTPLKYVEFNSEVEQKTVKRVFYLEILTKLEEVFLHICVRLFKQMNGDRVEINN